MLNGSSLPEFSRPDFVSRTEKRMDVEKKNAVNVETNNSPSFNIKCRIKKINKHEMFCSLSKHRTSLPFSTDELIFYTLTIICKRNKY